MPGFQEAKFAKGLMELIRQYPRAAAAFFFGIGGTAGAIIKSFHSQLKALKDDQKFLVQIIQELRLSFELSRREDLKYAEEVRRENLQKFSDLTVALYQVAFGHHPKDSSVAGVLCPLKPEEVRKVLDEIKIAYEQLPKDQGGEAA